MPCNELKCKLTNDIKKRKQNNRKYCTVNKYKNDWSTMSLPLPKELNTSYGGPFAREVLDNIFPLRNKLINTNWDSSSYINSTDLIRLSRINFFKDAGKDCQSTAINKSMIRRIKNTLNSAEDLIRVLFFGKSDKATKKSIDSLNKQIIFKSNAKGKLEKFNENQRSVIVNDTLCLDEYSCIIPESQVKINPVVIDGVSFLDQLFSKTDNKPFPKLSVKALVEILAAFILQGHHTQVFLPEYYRNYFDEKDIDEKSSFNFLVENKLVVFVNARNRRLFQSDVFMKAEEIHGILLTSNENLSPTHSVLCHPVINHFTDRPDDILLAFSFSQSPPAENVLNNLNNSEKCDMPLQEFADMGKYGARDSSSRINFFNCMSQSCLQIDSTTHQLTLRDQVFVISSFVLIADFKLMRARQIKRFLFDIKTAAVELLPSFLSEKLLDDILEAKSKIETESYPVSWPIFAYV